MNKNIAKTERRTKIRKRIRSTISGTAECPRISVYKSNKHLYVQLTENQCSYEIELAISILI